MEPRSRSLESSAEPHPHNLATAPTQGISSRSHSWPKGAPCPAPSSPTPAVSKSTGRLAAAVETPLKGSIYRALLKQCGLYLQVPALQGAPTLRPLAVSTPCPAGQTSARHQPRGHRAHVDPGSGHLCQGKALWLLPPTSPSSRVSPKLKESPPLSPWIKANSPLDSFVAASPTEPLHRPPEAATASRESTPPGPQWAWLGGRCDA